MDDHENNMKFIIALQFIGLLALTSCVFYVNQNSLKRDTEMSQLILDSEKLQSSVLRQELENQVILQAMSEDYPPKKDLGDRVWCFNRSCLPKE